MVFNFSNSEEKLKKVISVALLITYVTEFNQYAVYKDLCTCHILLHLLYFSIENSL